MTFLIEGPKEGLNVQPLEKNVKVKIDTRVKLVDKREAMC